MAITIVIVGGNSSTDGSAVTLNFPSNQENDVIYVCQGNAAAGTIDPGMTTAGYTLIASQGMNNINGNLSVYRKVLGPVPDASLTTGTGTKNAAHAVVAIVLRGVDTTTPEDATATVAFGASTNPNPAAIITVTDHAWVIPFAGARNNDATITQPSGYSNLFGVPVGSTLSATAAEATKEITPAGNEDPAAYTTWSSANWATITVAVRPSTPIVQSAIFSGVGSLSATAQLALSAVSQFGGASNLAVTARLAQTAAVPFRGGGSLHVTIGLGLRFAATFAGSGTLSANMAQIVGSPVRFSGSGSLRVSALHTVGAFAAFSAAGSLSVSTILNAAMMAEFGGLGHFCINALVRLGPPGARQNANTTGPGVTNNAIAWGRR